MRAESELHTAFSTRSSTPPAARRRAIHRDHRNETASTGSPSARRCAPAAAAPPASSSIRRSSRGTPGVKKNRARPMSIAKPQRYRGIVDHSAPGWQHRLLAVVRGMMRLRRVKKLSMRASQFLVQRQLHAGGLGGDLLRQVVDVGPRPPLTTTASARSLANRTRSTGFRGRRPTVVPNRPTARHPRASGSWR